MDLQATATLVGIAFDENGDVRLDPKAAIDIMDAAHDGGRIMDQIARMIAGIALGMSPGDPDEKKGNEEEGVETHSR
jgi:hypothetical protein